MAYDWNQWKDPDKALAEIARAGEVYTQAKARGDMAAAEAAHRHAQGVRQAAGIEGDGVTRTGLEGTIYDKRDPIQILTEARMNTKPVRETDYFVETKFDPRNYRITPFEEPKATLPGHIVSPALRESSLNEWLKKIGVMKDERAFDYGIASDAYNRNLGKQEIKYKKEQDEQNRLMDLWDRLGIAPAGIKGVSQGTAKYDPVANRNSYDLAFDVWDKTGYAPPGIPGVEEGTPLYDPNQQAKLDKVLAEQDKKMKGEVSGLLNGLRSGELTPQQAHNMIQQDLRAGQYTPDEAAQLEKVLNDYYYTTPPSQGGAFGPPNLSSGFNKKQKGGENLGASAFKNIISSNEGAYHSVNPNDNGALSIGKFQWHGNRAREIVQSIKTNDPATYHAVTGGQLDLSKSWDKKILNNRESLMISKLLNTQTGISVQDQIAARDLNGYIQKGRSLGIRDQGALAYFVDLYNQSPARAVEIAKRSDGSLRSLHQNAMIDPIMSKYKSRRESTYQKSMGV